MLITVELLERYTGTYKEADEAQNQLDEIYIKSAQAEIIDYLGYNPESKADESVETVVDEFALAKMRNVCLEIAALLAMEADNNLGVNTSSDTGGVSRSFLNVVDFSRYLAKLSAYRKNTEM